MLDATPHPPAEADGPHGDDDALVAGPQAWTSAGLLVAAATLSVVCLFLDYFRGARLHRADEIVPVVLVALGWLAAGLAVGNRHAGRVALGAAGAVGIAVADAGQRLADVGQAGAGNGAGPGLWLHVTAWAVGLLGAAVAAVGAARAGTSGRPVRPTPAGGRRSGAAARPGGDGLADHGPGATSIGPGGTGLAAPGVVPGLGLAAAAAGVLAAIAFVPSWDRYVVTSAVEPSLSVSKTLGYAFDGSNPRLTLAGNVITLVAFALVPLVAATWRPVRVGAALMGGVATVLAAQVLSAAVQVMETPDPRQILLPTDIQQLRPTVSLHLTGWYDLEMVALLVLLVVAASRLHHPARPGGTGGSQPAPAAPQAGGWSGTGWPPAPAGHDDSWATPRTSGQAPSWGDVPPPQWPDPNGGTP